MVAGFDGQELGEPGEPVSQYVEVHRASVLGWGGREEMARLLCVIYLYVLMYLTTYLLADILTYSLTHVGRTHFYLLTD